MGVARVIQDGSGFGHDSDLGYVARVQAGILPQVNERTSREAGYRYRRSNAKPDIDQDGAKLGSSQLDSSKEIYLGMNVYFRGVPGRKRSPRLSAEGIQTREGRHQRDGDHPQGDLHGRGPAQQLPCLGSLN